MAEVRKNAGEEGGWTIEEWGREMVAQARERDRARERTSEGERKDG